MNCPISQPDPQIITLAHGSGGQQTSQLIEEVFIPAFFNDSLAMLHDGAFLNLPSNKIVFSTDSFVVQPIFFPGGDIGKLAVTGTLNDLAMCGAKPLYLSCGFIIEEGFLQDDLKRIVASMKEEAQKNGVQIVTGDTKVIERHNGQNIFINTTGIGVRFGVPIYPGKIQQGDAIIISGDIGRHGMAVMSKRHEFSFSSPLISDCACLFPIVQHLLQDGIEIHCLRDLTRGGLATALVELAEASNMHFEMRENAIPVSDPVRSACEILGFDPLYVANEGRFVSFLPPSLAEKAISIMQRYEEGIDARIIGFVQARSTPPLVVLKNSFGSSRNLRRLNGDQLPRIC